MAEIFADWFAQSSSAFCLKTGQYSLPSIQNVWQENSEFKQVIAQNKSSELFEVVNYKQNHS